MKMNGFTVLGVIVLIILLIIIGPLLTIWSLNTLFPVLAIPYTLQTWAAAAILAGLVGGTSYTSKN
jgi:hypothetical protein